MWFIRETTCESVDLAWVTDVYGYQDDEALGAWGVVAEGNERTMVVMEGLESQQAALWVVALLTHGLSDTGRLTLSDTQLKEAVARLMAEEARSAN